ncbi:class I SAM-dependent methyltransferase [candidate division KSB1 bacterium]|nr:class I SAM-dependent methyltransferase [candidate division KSB1 bacterium]
MPTDEGYDWWSTIYDEEDNPLVLLEQEKFIRMLGDVHGLKIADLGCGTGRHTLRMATAGARVIGVDFSDGMLVKARAKIKANETYFIKHDLAQPLPFKSEMFDRVTCCLVLDHITNLRALFSEMKRICVADGFILISVMHPAMLLKGVEAQFTEPVSGQKIRPCSVPNQISDYVMAAMRAGLVIDEMREHIVDRQLAERSPRAVKYLGFPLLLLMRLRKFSRQI